MTPSVIGGSGLGGTPRTITKYPKIPPGPPVLGDRRRYIHFFATNFFDAAVNYSFDVLAGDTPPMITGGFAKWDVVDRPLRRGITIFSGYDPVTMQMSVRFMLFDAQGTWLVGNDAGLLVEESIAKLEHMAGEGVATGPPPRVYLTTYDSTGTTVPLIPFNYQAAAGNVPAAFAAGFDEPWIINGLTWDSDPIRNPNGYRVRQDGTVTVQYYTSLTGLSKEQKTTRPKATTFVSRAGADTALTIARTVPTTDPPLLARTITQTAQNAKLRLRSVNQVIKHGKRVYVPVG